MVTCELLRPVRCQGEQNEIPPVDRGVAKSHFRRACATGDTVTIIRKQHLSQMLMLVMSVWLTSTLASLWLHIVLDLNYTWLKNHWCMWTASPTTPSPPSPFPRKCGCHWDSHAHQELQSSSRGTPAVPVITSASQIPKMLMGPTVF